MKRSILILYGALALLLPAHAVAADSTLEGYGGESGAVLGRALEGLKDSGGGATSRGGNAGGGEITGGRSFGTALQSRASDPGLPTSGNGRSPGGAGDTGNGSNQGLGGGGEIGRRSDVGRRRSEGTDTRSAPGTSSASSPSLLPFTTFDVILVALAIAALGGLAVLFRSLPRPSREV